MASAATARHRAELDRLADVVATEIRRVTRRASVADVDSWFARSSGLLVGIVADGHESAAALAGRYLAALAASDGVEADPAVVEPDLGRIETALHVVGPVGFKQHLTRSGSLDAARAMMGRRMAATAGRLTLAGSRDSIMETVRTSSQIVGYRRVARPGACDFCTMLAGRGAVYKTERNATQVAGRRGRPRGPQRVGRSYHDSCRCIPEPIHHR